MPFTRILISKETVMDFCEEHNSWDTDDDPCDCITEYLRDLADDLAFELWRDRRLDV